MRELLTAAVMLMLAGCAGGGMACAAQDVWCAGLVTDFGGTAQGINQQAWLALEDAKAAGTLERVDRIETHDSRDRAANIAAFGKLGYDVIVTVGSSIADETTVAAKEYPGTAFIGVEQYQDEVLPNLAGLVFHEEQSGYLAGALASELTRTGQIGAVCEAKFVDSIRRYCEGYRTGAIATDPSVRVLVAYREGSTQNLFQDPMWGKAAAEDEVDQGIDVLFAAGGDTADAALEAAAARGTLVVATEADAYTRLPQIRAMLLTTAMNDVRGGVASLLLQAREHDLPAGNTFGRVELAPFHELAGDVPPSAIPQLDLVQEGLASGSIRIDIPYINP